ncbi:MAG: DUF1365 domain-containing protein [Verrucomicrobiota bacterium]
MVLWQLLRLRLSRGRRALCSRSCLSIWNRVVIKHSRIFRGTVMHERLVPTSHAFSYPVTFFGFDLSELSEISRSNVAFGYNETRPINIRDRDYLHGKEVPVVEQLAEFIGPETDGQRTLLISSPRYLGRAFNPVNFHLRMDGDTLVAAVAEVNNTFGDRHVYTLTELKKTGPQTWTARKPKDFHVSPFNNMLGEYHFTFRIQDDAILLGVDLHRDDEYVLKTWIRGKTHPLTQANLIRYFFLHPFDTALNSMPRIIWQAAILHYKKRLQTFKRPTPHSPDTLIDRDQPNRGAAQVREG